MFLLLIELLRSWFHLKVPAAFEYTSTRMALGALTALVSTIFFGKHFIRKLYEWKIGDKVRSEECPLLGELHRKKNDTPTMGGILILFSILFSLFMWMDLTSSFTWIFFITTVFLGMVGASDDYLKLRKKNTKGLSGRKKMLCQLVLSLGIVTYLLMPSLNKETVFIPKMHEKKEAATESLTSIASTASYLFSSHLYVPCMKEPLLKTTGWGVIFMGLFMMFVITGSSNAVNLTDGLDGLATGTVMLAASAFSLVAFLSNHSDVCKYLHIAYIQGSGEIAVFLSAVAGACLGFLWYNGHPAQVFMGDTGSLTLGGILGVAAVILKRELLLGIIGGVFVIEALSVIIQVASYRFRNKKRVFLCSPLHHHFEYQGWAEEKVVVRFWILGLLFALVGISTLKFQ